MYKASCIMGPCPLCICNCRRRMIKESSRSGNNIDKINMSLLSMQFFLLILLLAHLASSLLHTEKETPFIMLLTNTAVRQSNRCTARNNIYTHRKGQQIEITPGVKMNVKVLIRKPGK